MIPRRRWPLRGRDLRQWVRAACGADRHCQGQLVARFERAFRERLGCSYARASCSGRDALELALQALGLAPGDEIIIPAYTLGELLPSLQLKGLVPVPADVEADTFNIDPVSAAARIGPRTRAILVLHLHGAPADMAAIGALAGRHGLKVIEDCAHAMGASIGGRPVGTFGDAAFFSLEINKALPTFGGGIVVLKDAAAGGCVEEALAARPFARGPVLKKALTYWKEEMIVRSPLFGPMARLLMSPRIAPIFERSYRRGRDKMRRGRPAYSAFQARLGLAGLAELDERNARVNALWNQLAARLPEGLLPQRRDKVGDPAFYNFVALSTRVPPGEMRRRLFARGVDVGIGSEIMDDCAAALGRNDCPVAAAVFAQALWLPMYDAMTPRRLDRVVRALESAAK